MFIYTLPYDNEIKKCHEYHFPSIDYIDQDVDEFEAIRAF